MFKAKPPTPQMIGCTIGVVFLLWWCFFGAGLAWDAIEAVHRLVTDRGVMD